MKSSKPDVSVGPQKLISGDKTPRFVIRSRDILRFSTSRTNEMDNENEIKTATRDRKKSHDRSRSSKRVVESKPRRKSCKMSVSKSRKTRSR